MNLKRIFKKKVGGKRTKPKKLQSSKKHTKGPATRKQSFLAQISFSRPFRVIFAILVVIGVLFLLYKTVLLGLYNITKFQNLDFVPATGLSDQKSHENWQSGSKYNILLVSLNTSKTGHNQVQSLSVLQIVPRTKEIRWMIFPIESYINTEQSGLVKLKDLYIVGDNAKPNGGYEYLFETLEETLYLKFDRYVFYEASFLSDLLELNGGMVVRIPDEVSVRDQGDRFQVATFDESKINLSSESVLNFITDTSGGEEAKLTRQSVFYDGLVEDPGFIDLWRLVETSDLIEKAFVSDLRSSEFNTIWRILRSNLELEKFVVLGPVNLNEEINPAGETIKVFGETPVWEFIRENAINQSVIDELARVEVFNGSDVGGAAYDYTVFLRNAGVDVIRRNNAPKPYEKSVVYVQDKERSYSYTIDQILRIMPEGTEVKTESAEFLATGDIIIILGEDIKKQAN